MQSPLHDDRGGCQDQSPAGTRHGAALAGRAHTLLAGLRASLTGQARGLDVHYMQTVDVATRRRTGYEALVRFTHPQLGPISPTELVPLAEQHLLACCLGDFVRDCVIADIQAGLLSSDPIAINVSAMELAEPCFAERFLEAFDRGGVSARRIGVEVTETAALGTHFARAASALRTFQAAGVSVALDDFGTGYASLDYLVRLPCDTVKIDRSFVAGLGLEEHSAAIVTGVIDLAHRTGHQVIAEGVETERQLQALADLGCDEAQGYLFGRASRPSLTAASPPRRAEPRPGHVTGRGESQPPLVPPCTSTQAVIDLTRDIAAAPDLGTALRVLVTALPGCVEITGGSVRVVTSEAMLVAAEYSPAAPPATTRGHDSLLQDLAAVVMATGQLHYSPDLPPRAHHVDAAATGFAVRRSRSSVTVPLFLGSLCRGVLQLHSPDVDAFSADVQLLLAACAVPLGTLLAHQHVAGAA